MKSRCGIWPSSRRRLIARMKPSSVGLKPSGEKPTWARHATMTQNAGTSQRGPLVEPAPAAAVTSARRLGFEERLEDLPEAHRTPVRDHGDLVVGERCLGDAGGEIGDAREARRLAPELGRHRHL